MKPKHHSGLGILLLCSLISCGNNDAPSSQPQEGPPALGACSDAACREAWVLDYFPDYPQDVAVSIGGLTDPVIQVALVQTLAEAYPGQTGQLCDLLPEGFGQKRCKSINARPHLQQISPGDPEPGPTRAERKARASADDPKPPSKMGPNDNNIEPLEPSQPLTSPWRKDEPIEATCPEGGHQPTCQAKLAQEQAALGRDPQAAAACLGITDPKWQQECFFEASEAAIERGGPSRARTAAGLCLGAGVYQGRCLIHLAGLLGRSAPSSTEPAASWVTFTEWMSTAKAVIAPFDEALAERLMSQTYAEALAHSYRNARPVLGDPLRALPDIAAPHVRAAAAWRLMDLEFGNTWYLALWVKRVEEALGQQSNFNYKQRAESVSSHNRVTNLWLRNEPGEEDLTWTAYLGNARRAVHEDSTIDTTLCVLEAAARTEPVQVDLLEEGAEHEDSLVRWTALRLLDELKLTSDALKEAANDPDPLVRGRSPLETRKSAPHSRTPPKPESTSTPAVIKLVPSPGAR